MEQDTEYQKANAKIKELQQYYESLSGDQLQKAHSEAHKDIETHFEMCMKALEARKTSLIKQIDIAFEQQMRSYEEERERIKKSLDIFTDFFTSSCKLYTLNPEPAKSAWKSIYSFDNTSQSVTTVVGLPETLLNIIEKHGSVLSTPKHAKLEDNSQPLTFEAGEVSTLAGLSAGYQDGIGTNAKIHYPYGMVMNPINGFFYFCDWCNKKIRQVSTQGEVITFANVEALDITWYHKENCFFVSAYDSNTISKVSSTGEVTLISKAGFKNPRGITVDQQTGYLYICDFGNHCIRKITPQGDVSTLAGTCGECGSIDGSGSSARFTNPYGIIFSEKNQCLLICDGGNNNLRRVNLDGNVSTICEIPSPLAVEIINSNCFLVSSPSKIFKVTHQDLKNESAHVEEFAGSGQRGNKDGSPRECQIGPVLGMAFHEPTLTCYFTDFFANSIRKLKLLR